MRHDTSHSRSISEERDDRRVRTSDHEDSSVSSSNVLAGRQKDVANGDEENSSDDVEGSFSSSIRVPGVANDDEEGEDLVGSHNHTIREGR